jgi:hypothetical protein
VDRFTQKFDQNVVQKGGIKRMTRLYSLLSSCPNFPAIHLWQLTWCFCASIMGSVAEMALQSISLMPWFQFDAPFLLPFRHAVFPFRRFTGSF